MDIHTTVVQILSNFGAIEDEELDTLATEHLIIEGGISCLMNAWSKFKNSVGLLRAVLDALLNIGNDEAAAEIFMELGAMKDLLHHLKTHGYDNDIMKEIIANVAIFSSFTCGISAIEECTEDPLLLVETLSRFNEENITDNDSEALNDLILALANFSRSASFRKIVGKSNIVDCAAEVISSRLDSPQVILCITKLFSRLCSDEEIATQVTNSGLSTLIRICSLPEYKDNVEVVDTIFSLISTLTQFEKNMRPLVQHGGIKALVHYITIDKKASNPTPPDGLIVAKAMRTLEVIMTVSDEYTRMVIAMGVKKLVLGMMKLCSEDFDVQKAGDSLVKFIDLKSSAKSQAKTNRAALLVRLGEDSGVSVKAENIHTSLPEPKDDPLVQHRTLLSAGAVIRVYTDGKGHNRHVFANLKDAETSAIVVKDPVKNNKGGLRIVFSKLKEVCKGCHDDHKKRSLTGAITSKNASNENCSFFVRSTTGVLLAAECDSESNRDRWVAALEKAVFVHRTWPNKLKPPA